MTDSVQVVHDFVAAVGTLDLPTMLTYVHDDIVVELPAASDPRPREVKGKCAFEQFFAGEGAVWS
jgi:ketosteroid isomerase-like protein